MCATLVWIVLSKNHASGFVPRGTMHVGLFVALALALRRRFAGQCSTWNNRGGGCSGGLTYRAFVRPARRRPPRLPRNFFTIFQLFAQPAHLQPTSSPVKPAKFDHLANSMPYSGHGKAAANQENPALPGRPP